MKKTLLWCFALLIVISGLAGCSPGKGEKGPDKGVRPVVAVEVTKVTTAHLAEGVDVTGTLAPKFQSDVKAEYPGMITDIYVAEWVKVSKGTPLAKLDTRELQLILQKAEAAVEGVRASLLQAEVSWNRADREYGRLIKLKEVGLVTQQNMDDGLTEKDAASARIAAAKAQLRAAEGEYSQMKTRLSKATITSPMNGVVSQRAMNVGDLTGDKTIFRVVDNRLLDLTVTVSSKDMGSLRIGQPLTFSTNTFPAKVFTGKVKFINPAINEADRSVKVIAEVKNEPEELKGGLFVKGRIVTGDRADILQIPRSALATWDLAAKKGDVYFVKGDTVQKKTIGTGAIAGEMVEVTSGLSSGDTVVIRGGFNLKDGDRITIAPAGRG